MIGAASFTCSTVFPLMIASSSNSSAQPSLSTLKTMGSAPRFCAAIWVERRVRMLGLRNNIPTRLFAPRLLSFNWSALYARALATRLSMSVTSAAEIKFFIVYKLFDGYTFFFHRVDLFLDSFQELVGILFPQCQAWQQPDRVGLCFAGKDALTPQQVLPQVFEVFRHVEADHQAPAPDTLQLRDHLQFFHQVPAYLSGVGHQVLLFDDFQHGQGGSTGEMVTAKGSAQHSIFGVQVRRDHDAGHGKTIAHAFGHRIDVRVYS